MRVRWRLPILLTSLFAAFLASPAKACSCGSRPPCAPYRGHGPLFVADVVSSRPATAQERNHFQEPRLGRISTVRVLESFSDSVKIGQTLTISSERGTSCDFPLDLGQRYLLDSREKDGMYFTSECTLTWNADQIPAVLTELRLAKAGAHLANLSGSMNFENPVRPAFSEKPPVPGVRVTVHGLRTGSSFSAVTDANGVYQFDRLPNDHYQVTLDRFPLHVTANYASMSTMSTNNMADINLDVPGGDASACHLSFSAGPSGSISGRFLLPYRWLERGETTISYLPPDGSKARVIWAYGPESDGSFHYRSLPAGNYLIAYKPAHGRTVTQRTISLADGQILTGIEVGTRIKR